LRTKSPNLVSSNQDYKRIQRRISTSRKVTKKATEKDSIKGVTENFPNKSPKILKSYRKIIKGVTKNLKKTHQKIPKGSQKSYRKR
jgi:hypothetical protein